MSDQPIKSAMKVADSLAQVSMKHNYILLKKVILDEVDVGPIETPDEYKEHRLEVVAIGPGNMLADDKADRGWSRAPMSVSVGDMVQFHGPMIPIQVGNEQMVVIQDTQVFLGVGRGAVH